MPYNDPFFPNTVWDGLTFNRNRIDLNSNVDPNSDDWERIAAEVIAIEQYVTDNPPSGGSSITTITAASETLDLSNEYILADCSLNSITLTLPLASTQTAGKLNIKKIDSTSNFVTIDGSGSETVDGDLTFIINTQYESVNLVSDGSNWHIF